MRLKYSGSARAIKVINPNQAQSRFIVWIPSPVGCVIDCPDGAVSRLLALTNEYGNHLYVVTADAVTVQPIYQ